MEVNKVIAVMGSGGSGKTTLAMKLAKELADKRKNVILLFADPFTPAIPYLLPAGAAHEVSLGALLTAPAVTQQTILEALVTVKESGYITALGYKLGENLMTYPKITRDRVIDFLVLVRHLADYVIVDCSAIFEADAASIVAMETADKVIQMETANLKGVSYFHTHNRMMEGSRFGKEKDIHVLGNIKTGQEWEAVAQIHGGVQYLLPYAAELEQQFDETALFESLTAKESGIYMAELRKMVSAIFGLELDGNTEKGSHAGGSRIETKKPKGKSAFKNPFAGNRGEF